MGRESDLARIARASEHAAVVQILGPPGVGKSALLGALAATLGASGRRVVRAGEPSSGLLRGLSAELGAPASGDDAVRAIALALRASPAALLIDDADRHAEALTALRDGLAALAPEARVVLATRRALPLADAQLVELAPLPVPLAADLFRRRAADLDVPLDDGSAAHVEAIVRAAGGLPRAIELAAQRLRALSPQSLARRLADARDTTLDVVIARAVAERSAEELAALAALAHFRGAFSHDDAEALLSLAFGNDRAEPLLLALRDHSLVHRSDAGALSVLGPIGRVALRTIGTDRAAELAEVHAHLCATLPEVGREDLRAALAAAHDPETVALLARRFVSALHHSLASAADLELLDRAHELSVGAPSAREVAAVRAEARARANVPDAIDALRALVLASESAGDPQGAARALALMGQEHFKAFRMVEARVAFEQARARLEAAGDVRGALGAAHRLAALHCSIGQLAAAEAIAESVASEALRTGDGEAVAETLATLGTIALQRRQTELAASRYRESAARARALSLERLEAVVLGYGALAELVRGEPAACEALAELAVSRARSVGYVRAIGFFALVLAAARAELGRLDEAAREIPVALPLLDGCYATAGDLLAGLVDLAEARAAVTRDERDRAFGRAMSLSGRIQAARALRVGTGQSADRLRAVDVSDDLRIVLDLVERRIESLGPLLGERLRRDGATEGRAARISVAPGASRFRIDGQTVALAARPLLARLLWRLVQGTLDGGSTSSEELVSAGWPDERLPRRIGKTRLYVALAELRKLGLRDALESDRGGYRLAVDVEVELGG